MSDFRARIIAELDTSKIPSYIKKIEKERIILNNFTLNTKGFGAKIQQALNGQQFTLNLTNVKIDNLSTQITGQMRNVGNQAGQQFSQSMLNKINSQINNGGIDASITKVTQKFNQLNNTINNMSSGGNTTAIQQKLKSLESEFTTLHSLQKEFANGKMSDNQLVSQYEQFNNTLLRIKNSMTIVATETKQFASAMEVATLQNKMESWLNNNTRATKTYGTQVQNYINTLKHLSEQGNVSMADLNKITNGFKQVDMAAESAGLKGKSFGSSISGALKSITKYVGASTLIYSAFNAIQSGVNDIIALDTALVDLQKTTSANASQLKEFYFGSNDVAKSLGVTTQEVIQAAADWSRLGYNIQDAQTMAKTSSIFASISPGMDISVATDGLVSAMKAFDIEAEDALDGIASKINAIGNTQAVDNQDIVDVLTRSSSAMKEANNTLDETIALGTAAVEVTRDADGVGNALKTVSMRIRGYDEETEEYIGGVERLSGDIANLTKTASNQGGISLFTDKSKTEYKSTTQLLRDISKIYDELTDKQQAGLLEKLAGKRQGQIVAAILKNFNAVENSLETMKNSAGGAMQEMEVIEQSLEYKLNALKETVTGVFQNLFQTDDIGIAIEIFEYILEIIDSLIEKVGLFGTVIISSGIAKGIKSISSTYKTVGGDIKGIGDILTLLELSFPNASKIITNFTGALFNGQGVIQAFKGGLKGLWGVIAAHPIVATVVALTALFTILKKVGNATEEASKKSKESAQKAMDVTKKHDEEKAQVDELIAKYKELKTTEYVNADTRKEIRDIQKEINSLVGGETSDLDLVNGQLDDQLQKLKQVQLEEAKRNQSDYIAGYSSAKKSFDDAYVQDNADAGWWAEWAANLANYELTVDEYDEDAVKLLNSIDGVSAGLDNYFHNVTSIDFNADNAQEYYDILTKCIETMENDANFYHQNNAVYNKLVSMREGYKEFIGTLDEATISLVKNAVEIESLEFDISGKAIDSIGSYEDYRNELIEAVLSNESLDSVIKSKNLNKDDVSSLVDDFMSQNYSDYYNEWLKLQEKSQKIDAVKKAFYKSDTIKDVDWNIAEKRFKKFNDWFDNLSDEDKEIVYDISCKTDTAKFNLEDWQNALKNYDIIATTTIEDIKSSASRAYENTKSLIIEVSAAKDALISQSTGTSLSLENYNSDELKTYTSALEYHNGVLQLNAEKVRDIIKAKSEEQIKINNTNKANAQSKYLENAAQIEKLRQKIKEKNYEEKENQQSIQENIEAYLEENNTIKAQCDSYDLMTASLQEATDAYHNWLNTQNSAQNGDMFDDTLNAINRINETLNNSDSEYFGRVGRTDYKAALDLIIPDSVDSNDKKKINEYRKSIYDLFTYDDNGNYAGLNIENFCQKAVDKGLMVFDKSKDSYIIAGQKTMEDFAEGLNLSLPLVQAMFGEMEEFGGQFSWADEAKKTVGDFYVSANEAAESLRKIKRYEDLDIKLAIPDLSELNDKEAEDAIKSTTNNLEDTIKKMKDIKSKVSVDSSEAEYANQILQYCILQKQELNKPIIMSVDTSAVSDKLSKVLTTLQQYKNAYDNLQLLKETDVDTTEAKKEVNELADQIRQIDSSILVKLKVDTSSNKSLNESISAISGEQLTEIGVDDSAIVGWTAPQKEGKFKWTMDTTEIDSYNPDNLMRTLTYRLIVDDTELPDVYKKSIKDAITNTPTTPTVVDFSKRYSPNNQTKTVPGASTLNGTAHINGTAMAGGNWGARQGGETLVGELGREIVVNPHTGKWYTVGDNGAEFANIPKGSIVFNHKQTESLLANGYVAGRASALANGTAMVTGRAPSQGAKSSTKSGGNSTSNYGKTKSSKSKDKSSSSKNSDTAKDFEETFDWIEVAIDRVERAISKLDARANNVYKSWSNRNKNLTKEISKVSSEIYTQQMGYARYMNQATSVEFNGKGLSKKWIKKIKDGTIDITTIKNEKLVDKIKEYQQWYNKALDCKDAIEKLKETEASLYKQRFDNTVTKYDNILANAEHKANMINEYINQAETKGYIVSTKYYESLMGNEFDNISKLESKKNALINKMNQAVANGRITKGSEAWYEMVKEIDSVSLSIAEANTNLIEFDNSIRDIKWQVFDKLQEKISSITKETDFLIDLLSNEKLYDDRGQLTDEGMATMGMHAGNYETYMAQAKEYAKEISSINGQLISDPYDQDLINRREELIELQRESISAAEDEKQSIVDMVKEGIELELSALKELIDTYTDALDAQKDLYDYQKKISEQTKEKASLEKQLSSYKGDTSEEAKAKIQQIKVALEESKENLKETEYDKYVSDQKELLDDLYDEYEEILNQRLDDISALINDMITAVNDNKTTISDTIKEAASKVGYDISECLKSIWTNNNANIDKSVNDTVGKISNDSEQTMSQLDKSAKKASSSDNTSSVAKTNLANPKKKELKTGKYGSVWGDGKAQKGDKIDFKGGNVSPDPYGKGKKSKKDKKSNIYIAGVNADANAKYPYLIGATPDNTNKKKMIGWVKKKLISGYSSGIEKVPKDEYAWTQEGRKAEAIVRPSDGAVLTPLARNDSVLNHDATSNLFNFANDPREFIRDNENVSLRNILKEMSEQNLRIGSSKYSIDTTPQISGLIDISNLLSIVKNQNRKSNSTSVGDIHITIPIEHVDDYNDFVTQLQHDKQFERMVRSVSVDLLSAKSELTKNNYKW